ncbi:serine-rich adhesin for platelets [Lampris incognitus]|uniref:serine-rich adhesin for platelets n=1 Tax=Lampris incognitus TaxID=2546036 RepID=UPI0024B5585F|nr:serine-rich adhesin for platelets [Lampris incognitus]
MVITTATTSNSPINQMEVIAMAENSSSHRRQPDRHNYHCKQKPHHAADGISHSSASDNSSGSSFGSSSSSSSSSSTTTSSSSSYSSSSSTSTSSCTLSSESSTESLNKHQLRKPQHSQSCTDISRVQKAFEEEDTTPLIDDKGNVDKVSAKEKRLRQMHSHHNSAKGILKNKPRMTRNSGKDGSFRKAKSMEALPSHKERGGMENIDEDELERRNIETRKNLVKEKLKFSAFLNEITRQVLSPLRLTSLGVTDAHKPNSTGPAIVRSPKVDGRVRRQRSLQRRPSSADSVTSSNCSHTSMHSQLSKHSHTSRLSRAKHIHHHLLTIAPIHLLMNTTTTIIEEIATIPNITVTTQATIAQIITVSTDTTTVQNSTTEATTTARLITMEITMVQVMIIITILEKTTKIVITITMKTTLNLITITMETTTAQLITTETTRVQLTTITIKTTIQHITINMMTTIALLITNTITMTTTAPQITIPMMSTTAHLITIIMETTTAQHINIIMMTITTPLITITMQTTAQHITITMTATTVQLITITMTTTTTPLITIIIKTMVMMTIPAPLITINMETTAQRINITMTATTVQLITITMMTITSPLITSIIETKAQHITITMTTTTVPLLTKKTTITNLIIITMETTTAPLIKTTITNLIIITTETTTVPLITINMKTTTNMILTIIITSLIQTFTTQQLSQILNTVLFTQNHTLVITLPIKRPSLTIAILKGIPLSVCPQKGNLNPIHPGILPAPPVKMKNRQDTEAQLHLCIKKLQGQNEDLHHSLFQTAVRMECLGEEFMSSHQLLEAELQGTRLELSGLMEKFKRLQDNYSSTQQTNNLLEQKLHSVAQNMEGDRESLNQRISALTEQLAHAKTAANRETLNVRISPHTLDQCFHSDESVNQFVIAIAPPPAQFMDSHNYGKAKATGQEQSLVSVPEEEESDWSEIGEETPRFFFTGSNRGCQRAAAFSPWRHDHRYWPGQGEGDVDSESGGEEIVRPHLPRSLHIPHLQFTVHRDLVPVPLTSHTSPTGCITAGPKHCSPIRIRSASLEEIPLAHHMQEELRGTAAMMDLHHSEHEVIDDSDNEIIHHWRPKNDSETIRGRLQDTSGSEPAGSLASLQSAQRMLNHFICELQPSDGQGRAEVQGWVGGVPDEVLKGERTKL